VKVETVSGVFDRVPQQLCVEGCYKEAKVEIVLNALVGSTSRWPWKPIAKGENNESWYQSGELLQTSSSSPTLNNNA
jgi:hypothetical protein